MPPLSLQEAFANLQAFEVARVLAWLEVLRSFNLGYQYSASHGCLARPQLDALIAVQEFPDEQISAYLLSGGHIGNTRSLHGPHCATHALTVSPSQQIQQDSSRALHRSSAGSLAISSLPVRRSGQNTPRSPLTGGNSFLSPSREPSIDERASSSSSSNAHPHSHWCTVCEDPQPMSTCDGWKRHMKEHETFYPCILCGPVSILGNARKYTRKANLVKHLLDSHSKPNGPALADQWKHTRPKKFYACGFCITCFKTITDLLNHVDIQHYRQSHHISHFDHNRVIMGLLLQADVIDAWQSILASKSLSNSDCSWDPSIVAEIQLKLELREEPPEVLAEEAFTSTVYYNNLHAEDQPMTALDRMDQDMDAYGTWPAARPEPNDWRASLSSPLRYHDSAIEPSSHSYTPDAAQPAANGFVDGSCHGSSRLPISYTNVWPVTPYHQNIISYHNQKSSSQPASPSTNIGTTDTQLAVGTSWENLDQANGTTHDAHVPPPNYFRGIGEWQGLDFGNASPTASASEPSDYQNFQPYHLGGSNADTKHSVPTIHDRLDPSLNSNDSITPHRGHYSLSSNFRGKISLSISEDDDTGQQSPGHEGRNVRQRSRRADKDPRDT